MKQHFLEEIDCLRAHRRLCCCHFRQYVFHVPTQKQSSCRLTPAVYHPKIAAQPALAKTNSAQKPNTSLPVFPVLIFREPAIAANPIVKRIRIQIEKMSNEPASDFKTADVSGARSAARFVGTIPAGCVGSM